MISKHSKSLIPRLKASISERKIAGFNRTDGNMMLFLLDMPHLAHAQRCWGADRRRSVPARAPASSPSPHGSNCRATPEKQAHYNEFIRHRLYHADAFMPKKRSPGYGPWALAPRIHAHPARSRLGTAKGWCLLRPLGVQPPGSPPCKGVC